MTTFNVMRKTDKDYAHMMDIWHWCEDTFGKQSYRNDLGWWVGWAWTDEGSNQNEVTFFIYEEEHAILFALRWL